MLDAAVRQGHHGLVMIGWLVLGLSLAAVAIGFAFLFRSFRRWKQLPSGDSVADSELMSTRNLPQR